MQPLTYAIVQARFAASRLPGKVLLDIAGQPMLVQVVERTRRAKRLNGVVVATSTDPADDAVAMLCAERGYLCYRGSLHDVLDRFYGAACMVRADVIARITADCPVMDPEVIDETLGAFLDATGDRPDFAATRLPPPWHRTYPIGLDVEVCSFQALERAWKEGDQPHHREHVMPYLYEQAGRFRVRVLDLDSDYGSLRWTVDTPEDLALVREIYARLGGRNDFSWREVLALFQQEPELARMNIQVKAKVFSEVDQRREAGNA
jgi:spore coat polysaccharide biosynthesis protein SpsF